MNKDQIKGTIKVAAGKAQKKVGEVVGSSDQQIAGITKVAEGKTQKLVGDVKDLSKQAADHKR